MDKKKRMTVLIIIAIILAITATYLNVAESDIPTTRNSEGNNQGPAQVGIDIIPAPIEDKLAEGVQS
ncbi:MAG: hypothetical protein KJ592_02220 [Nanoarchaeota archaeon]|nr:hypothetical protein [Nanoarchaeota archaeon]